MESSWLQKLGTIAPSIATAFLGPLGGAAVSALGSALGLTNPTEADLKALNLDDPETRLKLQQAENEFQLKMREFEVADNATDERDRESARNRQIALKDYTLPILAYISVLSFITFAFMVEYFKWQDQGGILHSLEANAMLVLSYYFGYSHTQSKLKSDTP